MVVHIAKNMKIWIPLALLLLGYKPSAQVNSLPPIIKKLLSVKGQVIIYPQSNKHLIDIKDLPNNFNVTGQFVLKTPTALLVCVPGTGRVYKLDSLNKVYRWVRIDSTYFAGYNFFCTYFYLGTTLYSFGGDGYWHVNGNLRYYNPRSKEWNARLLSEEIPFGSNHRSLNDRLQILDTANGCIYIQGLNISANYIKNLHSNTPYINKIFRLDVGSGNWTTIGMLKDSVYSIFGISPWGLFVDRKSFIDLKNNRVNRLSTEKSENLVDVLAKSTNNETIDVSFFIDSTLFLGNYSNFIDSFKISSTDIIQTDIPFYTPIPKDPISKEQILIAIIGGLAILSLFLLIRLYSKNKSSLPIASLGIPREPNETKEFSLLEKEKESTVSFRSSKIVELLEERERDLLSFIYNQSIDERLTSIDEINKIIGASQRSSDIQKRLRSDLINSINEKLSKLTNSNKPVIDKLRSDYDKRSFEYFIHPEQMEFLKKIVEE